MCTFVYMYISVYTHTHTHTHRYQHMSTYIHIRTHIYTHTPKRHIAREFVAICVCVYVYIHTPIHMYIYILPVSTCKYTNTHMCVCVCACVHFTMICTHAPTHILLFDRHTFTTHNFFLDMHFTRNFFQPHARVLKRHPHPHGSLRIQCTRKHTCVCVLHTNTCVYASICTYTCKYVCVCVCVYHNKAPGIGVHTFSVHAHTCVRTATH